MLTKVWFDLGAILLETIKTALLIYEFNCNIYNQILSNYLTVVILKYYILIINIMCIKQIIGKCSHFFHLFS